MQFLKSFFSIKDITRGFAISICFSAFIYLYHFHVNLYLLNTLLALSAFYMIIVSNKKSVLFAGFFIGILWFYWIGFSFKYYDMSWAVPLVALGFGAVYAFIFWVIALPSNPFLRALLLFLLSFFEPFNFNWLQPELLFVNSYLGVQKWEYGLILLSLALFANFKQKIRYLFLVPIVFTVNITSQSEKNPPFEIELIQTHYNQEYKWNRANIYKIVEENFKAINNAIEKEKKLIVLPESAFPIFLNRYPIIVNALLNKSDKISIIAGSLFYENKHNFNAAYFFQEGKMKIAKKMVLVPFGEYIPLPSFLARPINKAVFGGAVDYLSASKPTDFLIKGVTFRNAICYEATRDELFKDNPKYMIAISNNAWFDVSIEPTIQRLLMKFYAKKYNTTIFHSANSAGGGIISP